MSTRTKEQKLRALELEKAALLAEIKAEQRKQDTKRKILYGAAALALSAKDADLATRLLEHLNSNVNRDSDRELLGLPKRSK